MKTHQNNEILFVASYPPRECGIATYTSDLIHAVRRKFCDSFSLSVCAIDEKESSRTYPAEVKYRLQSFDPASYEQLARQINGDDAIKVVFIQHEFGLHGGRYGSYLLGLLHHLKKPVMVTFHTVLPNPEPMRRTIVQEITDASDFVVLMTERSAAILEQDYDVPESKISIIPHGTHLLPWRNKQKVKEDHHFEGRLILSTFGLMGPNKSIETALSALKGVVDKYPNVLYLVIGKTHPCILENEGESYRRSLEAKVEASGLQNNVRFIDKYLALDELLQFLFLTDIYLFTSKDPNQAVSGTFAYAMSCACPTISTPIPHALEMLSDNAGIIVGFESPAELQAAIIKLLDNEQLRYEMGLNAFHQTRKTIWENTAISHARLFNKLTEDGDLIFSAPPINLHHFRAMTTKTGMIQFSNISEPDINSGYTLDDNSRAIIALCLHLGQTGAKEDLPLLETYLQFIEYCQQPHGLFLNYVDKNLAFQIQNNYSNLEDSNGRAIWALGTIIEYDDHLPSSMVESAKMLIEKALPEIVKMESPRAIAFSIKGLHFFQKEGNARVREVIDTLAGKLLSKFNHVADSSWKWFEDYLTYANGVLPEAMLYAYLSTNKSSYKIVGHVTFDFLLSHLFTDRTFKVVSNQGWHKKNQIPNRYGEQPIDVAYTIRALLLFYNVFKDEEYLKKLETAFSWFLGNNHLNQIIYNPVTGGCYDGLEEHSVNLNQGAESTVCYLMARMTLEKARKVSLKKQGKTKRKRIAITELAYSKRWSAPLIPFKRLKSRAPQY